MPKKNGTGLKYVPLNDFSLIPKYLIEQIESLQCDIDRLYGAMQLSNQDNNFWNTNLVGVFADHDHVIKGFMWLSVNHVTKKLHIHMLSIDKEYHGKGIVGETQNIVKKIMRETDTTTATFLTETPEIFDRKPGVKRSKSIMMEMEL